MSTIGATLQIYDRFTGPLRDYASGIKSAAQASSTLKNSMNGAGNGISFEKPRSELSALGDQAQKTGGMLKSMLGANIIGAGIIKGISAMSSSISGLMGDLSASSATWQTFQGNMEQLGTNQTDINSAKKAMQDYATQTIYSASDMASTYSQLAAVGTKNTGELVKGFGGLAAASEDPAQAMKTLSQQATQMAAKPKVAWEDFKLMLEQSPAGMAAVAKTMGMSTGQLISKIQAGTVKTQDFFDAIQKTGTNDNFTKMATQFKTVGQAVDGLKETLTNALQPAFDKVSKIGIAAVSNLSDMIGSIDFSAIADKIIGFFSNVGKKAAEFWDTFKSTGAVVAVVDAFFAIKGAIDMIVSSLQGINGNGLLSIKNIATVAGNVVVWLANQVDNFATFIQRLDPSTIQAIAVAIGVAAAGFVTFKVGVSIFNTLKTAAMGVKTALDFGKVLVQSIAKLFGLAGAQAAAAATSVPLAAGETAVGTAASASAGQILAMGAAILMVGVGILVAAAGMWVLVQAALALAAGGWPAVGALLALVAVIAILVVGAVLLGPALIVAGVGMMMFGAAALMLGAGILLAAAGITLLATQLPTIAAWGTSAAVGLLALGAASIVFGAGALIAGVGLVILGAGLLVVGVGATGAAIGMLLLGAATMVFGVGLLIVSAAIMIVAAGFAMIASVIPTVAAGFLMLVVPAMLLMGVLPIIGVELLIIGAGALVAGAGLLMAGAGALVAGAGMVVLAAGIAFVGASLMVLAAGIMALYSTIASIFSQIVSAVSSAMNNVVTAVSGGIQRAIGAVQGVAGSLVSAGRDFVMGFVNGITGAIGAAADAAANMAKSAMNAAKKFLGIHSPSRMMRDEVGYYYSAGMAVGIDNGADLVTNSATNMAQSAFDAASNISAPTLDAPVMALSNMSGANIGDVMANGFTRAANALDVLIGKLIGLDGANATINSSMNNTPSSSPLSLSGNVNGTTNNSDQTVNFNFGNGSIVVQTNGGESGEELLDKIAAAARNYSNKGLSFG